MIRKKKLFICLLSMLMVFRSVGPGVFAADIVDRDELEFLYSHSVTTVTVCGSRFNMSGAEFTEAGYNDMYYFDGAFVKGGKWHKNKKGWWYQFSDGTYPTDACIVIDKSYSEAITTWKKFDRYNLCSKNAKTKYRLDIDYNGKMYVNYKEPRNVFTKPIYYFDSNGYLVTSKCVHEHMIGPDGEVNLLTGHTGRWKHNKKGWWFQIEMNKYLKDGFYTIYPNGVARYGAFTRVSVKGTYVYYFDRQGYMATGWRTIDGKKYYFDSNGHMVTGKKKINSKIYKFDSDGVLQ